MKIFLLLMMSTISLYLVAQDQDSLINVTVITSKNQMLYSGIDNYLIFKNNGKIISFPQYSLSTNNGVVKDADSCYLMIPRFTGNATVKIFRFISDKDSTLIDTKTFKVLNLPLPSLRIGTCTIGTHTPIDRNVFLTGDSLKIFFSDDLVQSDTWCRVKAFNLGYQYGNNYISIDNPGPLFSEETIRFLNKIISGQEVVIKINNISTSHLIKNLPLIRFILK